MWELYVACARPSTSTFLISPNHQAGTSAVSVERRFNLRFPRSTLLTAPRCWQMSISFWKNIRPCGTAGAEGITGHALFGSADVIPMPWQNLPQVERI